MDMIASGAAVLVGLFLLLKLGLPLLRAQRTGVLIGKSSARGNVERDVDLDRFNRLFSQRRAGLIAPVLLVLGGGAYLSLCIFGLTVLAHRG
jgi:hypothetical protein